MPKVESTVEGIVVTAEGPPDFELLFVTLDELWISSHFIRPMKRQRIRNLETRMLASYRPEKELHLPVTPYTLSGDDATLCIAAFERFSQSKLNETKLPPFECREVAACLEFLDKVRTIGGLAVQPDELS
jgi:hypothetical protein